MYGEFWDVPFERMSCQGSFFRVWKAEIAFHCGQACHNERVAKSRRHAEMKKAKAKRDKEKELARERAKSGSGGGQHSGSNSMMDLDSVISRDRDLGGDRSPRAGTLAPSNSTVDPGRRSPSNSSAQRALMNQYPSSSSSNLTVSAATNSTNHSVASSPSFLTPMGGGSLPAERPLPPSPGQEADAFGFNPTQTRGDGRNARPSSPSLSEKQRSMSSSSSRNVKPDNSNSMSPMMDGYADQEFRGSGEESQPRPIGLGVGLPNGLGVPTSKADKRRSMNPGMMFNFHQQQPESQVEHSGSAPSSISSTATEGYLAGRSSTLPPSPLRSSFTDVGPEAFPSRTASPTPRSGSRLHPDAGQRLQSRSDGSLQGDETTGSFAAGPPRSSSLTDTSARQDGSSSGAAPQIKVPALPSLNFSLSDPDFALLLNDDPGNPSPAKSDTISAPSSAGTINNGRTRTQTLGDHVTPLRNSSKAGTSSLPNSPSGSKAMTSAGLSPPLDKLGFIASMSSPTAQKFEGLPSFTRTISSGGTEDTDTQSSSAYEHVRRGSADTATLSPEKNQEETIPSVVPLLQALISDDSPRSGSSVNVGLDLLQNTVKELVHLNEQLSVYKGKYTGAKVSTVAHRLV